MAENEDITRLLLLERLEPLFERAREQLLVEVHRKDFKKSYKLKEKTPYQVARKKMLLLWFRIREVETHLFGEAFFCPDYLDKKYDYIDYDGMLQFVLQEIKEKGG